MKKIIFAVIGILLLGIGTFWYFNQPKPLTLNPEKEFWVISDNHFLAKSLHDNGEAFEKINETTIGKDIRYSEEVLTSFVKKALKEKPGGILITGDTTLNGELMSLQTMAKIFAPLKKAGIPVLAIPGNHDIYDGWARKFVENRQQKTSEITPEDFKKYFSDGYQLAVSQDPSSLSYEISLGDYRLYFLDSNLYGKDLMTSPPATEGRLKASTLEWLEKELQKSQQTKPVLLLHHNVLGNSKQMVLNNSEALQDLIKKYHISVAFTGHTHAQRIQQVDTLKGFTEITTSAFSIAESHVGHLKFSPKEITYEVENFDPVPYFTKKQMENPDLKNYPTYLSKLFVESSQHLSLRKKQDTAFPNEEIEKQVTDFIGEMNLRYFTGKTNYSKAEWEKVTQSLPYQQMLQYAPELKGFIEKGVSLADHSNLKTTIKNKQ